MRNVVARLDQLPDDVLIVVNQVCNRFERQWQSGNGPPAETQLADVAPKYREALLHELVRLEIEYRRAQGSVVDLAEYRERFPHQEAAWLASMTANAPRSPTADALGHASDRFDKYEISEELGRGGMGVVYRARELELGREVALKTLLGDIYADPIQLQRFQLEAKATATLDHPNIVPIYEVGTDDGRPYLAMKLIGGGSVADYVSARSQQSTSRDDQRHAARLVADVADAIQHAHERGILHRDLKPANILLDSAMTPIVTDFGLAKLLRDRSQSTTTAMGLTKTNAVVGTPAYMAPEQASGDPLTTATDVYALGAILYELLTSQRPFGGNTFLEVIAAVKHDAPASPSRLVPGLPRDLETICLKCLEKRPQQRYSSAAALSADLRRFLRHEPISARPVPAWGQLTRLARRHPTVASLIGAMVAVVLLSLGVITWKWREAEAASHEAKAALLDSRTVGYIRLIEHAEQELEDGNYGAAKMLLGQCETELCSVEYHYLAKRLHRGLQTLEGHEGPVRSVVCHPDGWLASAGDDRTIRIWDVHSGETKVSLVGHNQGILSLAVSPDGTLLASGDAGGAVRLWNLSGGQPLFDRSVVEEGKVTAVAFSGSSDLFATGDDRGRVLIWSAETGNELYPLALSEGVIQSLSFAADGTTLAVATRPHRFQPGKPAPRGGTAEIGIWHTESRQRLATLPGHAFRRRADIRSVRFSPSRQYRRLYTGGATTIHSWSQDNWERPLMTFRGHHQSVYCVAPSARGTLLASGDAHGSVKLWDAHRGVEVATFSGHRGPVHAVDFFDDAIVSAGQDGTIRIWRPNQSREQPGPARAGEVTAIDVAPSGLTVRAWTGSNRWMTSSNPAEPPTRNATLTITDRTEAYATKIRGSCATLAISPDETRIACAGQDAIHVVTPQGQWLYSLHDSPAAVAVSWSEDGQRIITSHQDLRICVWSGHDGTMLDIFHATARATHVALHAATDLAASIAGSDVVSLWQGGQGHSVLDTAASVELCSLAVSPDGKRIAAGSRDGRGWVWNASSGEIVSQLQLQSQAPLRAVRFSQANRRLVTLSARRRIAFWDLATGRLIYSVSASAMAARWRMPDLGGWQLGFGQDPGSFYAVIAGQVTWFPARPTSAEQPR